MALSERDGEGDWFPIMPLSLCHLTSWVGAAYFSTMAHLSVRTWEEKRPDSGCFLKKQTGLRRL